MNTPHTATATPLKVLTYNIYHGEKFYSPGKPNLDEIAEIIAAEKPDLVALQEVDRHTRRSAKLYGGVSQDLTQELARMTGMHGYFGRAMEQHGGDYGEAILTRTPAVRATNHPLAAPSGGEPRALLQVELALTGDRTASRTLTFAGTHLCHQHEANRLAQVQEIIRLAEAAPHPFILAGDFNFETGEAPYHALAHALQDTGVAFGNPQHTWPVDQPSTRLDIIFTDKRHHWIVKDHRLLPHNASDHHPVIAILELTSRQERAHQ
ncbi:endonuclease/exonuclease/phosphatase family protein [Cephaloticoccus primus]|nr:endonuclease/exonuclease/phosphatase family protein [Cephaloticoccus primus]